MHASQSIERGYKDTETHKNPSASHAFFWILLFKMVIDLNQAPRDTMPAPLVCRTLTNARCGLGEAAIPLLPPSEWWGHLLCLYTYRASGDRGAMITWACKTIKLYHRSRRCIIKTLQIAERALLSIPARLSSAIRFTAFDFQKGFKPASALNAQMPTTLTHRRQDWRDLTTEKPTTLLFRERKFQSTVQENVVSGGNKQIKTF